MPVGFVVFKAIRKAKYGGLMCAIREELNPKLIEEYNNPFVFLVVEVEVIKALEIKLDTSRKLGRN